MLPNFLIVGAPRSGTTSLYHYLKQHPEIYMSPLKEVNYFSLNYSKFDLKKYESFFKGAKNEKAIGEASPSYLRHKNAPVRIKKIIPECKIIILLRDPIDRFYSDYFYLKKNGIIKYKLEDILDRKIDLEDNRYFSKKSLIEKGIYFDAIKLYLDIFGKTNVLIHLFDDLKDNSLDIIKNVYEFLEVDKKFTPLIKIYNSRNEINKTKLMYIFKFGLYRRNYLKKQLANLKNKVMTVISTKFKENSEVHSEEVDNYLRRIYKDDTAKVSLLINRDLSNWKVNK